MTLILGLGEVRGKQPFQHVRKVDIENFREENQKSRRMEVRETKNLDRKTKGKKNTQFISLILWLPLTHFLAFTFSIVFAIGIIIVSLKLMIIVENLVYASNEIFIPHYPQQLSLCPYQNSLH